MFVMNVDSLQKLAEILYNAAKKGMIDPFKVEEILKVPRTIIS